MTILLLILTVLIFLGIDVYARRGKAAVSDASPAPIRPAVHPPAFRFPDGIYFSKTHTWMALDESGGVRLGVDDFATRMFLRPHLTLLKKEGEAVEPGDAIIRLEEDGRALVLRAPIAGRIERCNPSSALASAEAPAESAFARRWAYRITPSAGASVVRGFLLGAEMRQWMNAELARLRDFLAALHAGEAGASPALLQQDGGEPMSGLLTSLDREACRRIEQEFFSHM